MRTMYLLFTVLLCAGFCCSCGTDTAESSLPQKNEAETTTTTAITSVITTTHSTNGTTGATITHTSVSYASLSTHYTTTIPSGTLLQGGEGGELHADEPHPRYFTYRFQQNYINVRISGGNYQNLFCDLSGVDEWEAEEGYYLNDCDFDGEPDLWIPIAKRYSDTQYAVFRWNPNEKYFDESPILLTNPIVHADEPLITELYQVDDDRSCIKIYQWNGDQIEITASYTADFFNLTLETIEYGPDNHQVLQFDTTEELTSVFLSWR